MQFNMIFTICPHDHVAIILDAVKKAGATGATVLSARGTGHKEAKTFFGLTLDKPQEALVMLVSRDKCQKIMETIYGVGQMKKHGYGICFSLPVDSVMGFESQIGLVEKKADS